MFPFRAFPALAFAAAFCAAAAAGADAAADVLPANSSSLSASAAFGGGVAFPDATFRPCAFTRGWVGLGSVTLPNEEGLSDPGTVRFRLKAGQGDSDPAYDGKAVFSGAPDGALHASWRIVPDGDADLAETFIGGEVPFAVFGGGKAIVDGKPIALPTRPSAPAHLFRGRVSTLSLVDRSGAERWRFDFDRKTDILLQDNRHWAGDALVLRFFFSTGSVKAGTEYSVALDFSAPADGPISFGDVSAGKFRLDAGSGWVPLRYDPWIVPGSALDFTSVVPHHEPAGKFGRVVAAGGHFEFEFLPGVPQRFYGANVCGTANLPKTQEEADRFAANLARIGYNSLRLHHHERWLVAEDGVLHGGVDDTVPDPAPMDRFDMLVAACVRHGIYLTTDLYVSRSHVVPWRALGIDRDGPVPADVYKLLVAFHEPAFENLVAWTRNFLLHLNPYTGRCLAEEPALATLALVNEGNLGNFGTAKLLDVPGVKDAWNVWLEARGGVPGAKADVDNGAFAKFLAEREIDFNDRLRAVVRDECGCLAPLSSLSGWYNPLQYQLVRERFDYVDRHFYVDHPQFLGKQWRLPSRCSGANPLLGATKGVPKASFSRLPDKPFCITEFNFSGPGNYRGLGGIATGAIGALQGWGGMWRFAWSHSHSGLTNPGGRLGYFDVSGDPLALAAERAVACLFLRGDVPELQSEAFENLDPAYLADPATPVRDCNWPGRLGSGWIAKLGTRLSAPAAAPAAAGNAPSRDAASAPAVSVDNVAGSLAIDTPLTSGGFAESGALDCGVLSFEILPEAPAPAAVWASSLDGAPLRESSHVLLTHLVDVQNSGTVYGDKEHKILLDWGGRPHIMRLAAARVELRLADLPQGPGDSPNGESPIRVYRLDSAGRRLAEIPYTAGSGVLAFDARTDYDPSAASYLYEIVRE